MATETLAGAAPATGHGDSTRPADVLVVFGITGDLAKVMTLHSLYRLEARGLLNCPIVGVAVNDWTVEQLRAARPRVRSRHAARRSTRRSSTASPARLSYVSGDFADAGDLRPGEGGHRRRPEPGLLPGDPAVAVRRW